MLSVVMAAAFNLFDAKVNLKKLASCAHNTQALGEDLRPNAVTGQGHDVIGLFGHRREKPTGAQASRLLFLVRAARSLRARRLRSSLRLNISDDVKNQQPRRPASKQPRNGLSWSIVRPRSDLVAGSADVPVRNERGARKDNASFARGAEGTSGLPAWWLFFLMNEYEDVTGLAWFLPLSPLW